MFTGMTLYNTHTGAVRTLRFQGQTHGHWSVHPGRDGWCLQWGYREGLGTAYAKPWPQHRGLPTRKAAEALKRELREAGTTGWNGPPAAPEVP